MYLVRFTRFAARFSVILFTLVAAGTAAEPTWKAGWSSAVITPHEAVWMAGFGNRTQPADGTLHDLQIKVLALEDGQGQRAVLLAGDLLGIPKSIYDHVCETVADKFQLDRSQIMLNSSHTHNSPVLRGALLDVYPLDEEQLQRIESYSARLEDQIVATVGGALRRMVPVELFHGEGDCGFSFDRQWDQDDKLIQHVPVLAVRSPAGKLRVIVLTYACHPTSLKRAGWRYGEYATLLQKWSPDFPQFAVEHLQTAYPGAMALYTQGCGGDRSAPQEGRLEKTRELGRLLGAAVEQVLSRPMHRIEPRLRTAFRFVELPYGAFPAEEYLREQLKQSGGSSFLARWAARLLEQKSSGRAFPRSYREFPVQVWKLGQSHVWVSLGGETVSEYSIRIRDQLAPGARVLGYTNDVMAYIPTPEIIRQGQYIGQHSMAVYGVPATRWSENIQEIILSSVRALVADVNR